MTKEEKDLLIQDLCSRLPYGVKIELRNSRIYHHENISKGNRNTIDKLKGFTGKYFTIYHDDPLDWSWSDSDIEVEDIKPYLFPMSSMTEEQKDELSLIVCDLKGSDYWRDGDIIYVDESSRWQLNKLLNFYHENHLDYQGLIEKGLARDATGLGIY